MSSCPSVRCRNTGSGYVKPSGESQEATKKLNDLLAARSQQDTTYFPPITPPLQQISPSHPLSHPLPRTTK